MQLSELIKRYRKRGAIRAEKLAKHIRTMIDEHLKTAKEIYRQQREMETKKTRPLPIAS